MRGERGGHVIIELGSLTREKQITFIGVMENLRDCVSGIRAFDKLIREIEFKIKNETETFLGY